MQNIRIAKKNIKLPEHRNELSMAQAKFFVAISREQELNEWQKKEKLLEFIVSKKIWDLILELNKIERIQLLQVFDEIFAVPAEPTLTIQEFKFSKQKFRGPSEGMGDSPICEWVFADSYFEGVPSDNRNLDYLCACLFLPVSEKGERQDFETDTLENRAKLFRRLDPVIKLEALYFFLDMKIYIAKKYKRAFSKNDTDISDPLGWDGTFLTLAESQIFGDYEKVKYTNMHDVFTALTKKADDNRRLKRTQGR